MNPNCARCSKTVYPMEKLSCLDKFWHKLCFNCEVCKTTLNMKNYKGYDKKPYCNSHYPSTKFTTVADTPENLRLAQQSKSQSHVEYQKDFKTDKGKYTVIADDPETQRHKQNTKISSMVEYHGLRERNTQMEERRKSIGENSPAAQHANGGSSKSQMGTVVDRSEPVVQHLPPQIAPKVTPNESYQRAMYDYRAADSDEISFREGDLFTDIQIVAQGWVTATNQRTGQSGMVPENYITPV